jgi:2-oxoglutarate dehydrogenase E1 component
MKFNSIVFNGRQNLLRRIHIRQCSNCKTYTLDDIETSFRMLRMVRNFRVSGHFAATLDPLNSHPDSSIIRKPTWLDEDPALHPDVVRMLRTDTPDLSVFGLENVPMDKEFYLGPEVKFKGKLRWTIRELLDMMRMTYSGNVGIEIYHIENLRMRSWIQQQVEGVYGPSKWNILEPHERKRALLKLMESDHTSQFLGSRFSSAKIFEIEGCEALLPALWSVTTRASELGIDNIEMGMSHRGRMNVLRNFFRKSFGSICNKFNESETYSGDIKFHLGAHSTLKIPQPDGEMKDMHVSLCANPSHLEAVYPVVIGKTRAKQFYVNDRSMSRVMPLVLHG